MAKRAQRRSRTRQRQLPPDDIAELVEADERHGNALALGDLVLVYLGSPEREFIGRVELASAVHDWTPSEAPVYPGDSPSGVSLALVEE